MIITIFINIYLTRPPMCASLFNHIWFQIICEGWLRIGLNGCRAAQIYFNIYQNRKMKHHHSKSVETMPRSSIRVSQISTQQSILKLPRLKHISSTNLSHVVTKVKKRKSERAEPEEISPFEMEIMEKIRQKSKLLGQLKQKILECGDNLFVKKLLSEIKFTSLGKLGIQMWQEADQFEKCNKELLDKIQEKYQLRITQQSLRTMDFINNVCRFMLADYKRKRWVEKEKDVNKQAIKNKGTMKQVGKRIQEIDTPQTKMEIVLSLAGMKQECFAKKQCYLNWKQRAIEKLKSNQVKCKILRAEIFTEGFY